MASQNPFYKSAGIERSAQRYQGGPLKTTASLSANYMPSGGLPALPSVARDPNQVASPNPIAATPGGQLNVLSQLSGGGGAQPQQSADPGVANFIGKFGGGGGGGGSFQDKVAAYNASRGGAQGGGAQQDLSGAGVPGGIHPAVLAQMTPEAALLMQRISEQEASGQALDVLQQGNQQATEGVNIGEMMGPPGLDDNFWNAARDLGTDQYDREFQATLAREQEQAVANGWYGTQMWNQRVAELQDEHSQSKGKALAGMRQDRAGMIREDRLSRAQLEVQQRLGLAPYQSQYTRDIAGLLQGRADNWTGAYDWLQAQEGDQMQLMNADGTMRALTPAQEALLLNDLQQQNVARAQGNANDMRDFRNDLFGNPVPGVPAIDPNPWGRGWGNLNAM